MATLHVTRGVVPLIIERSLGIELLLPQVVEQFLLTDPILVGFLDLAPLLRVRESAGFS